MISLESANGFSSNMHRCTIRFSRLWPHFQGHSRTCIGEISTKVIYCLNNLLDFHQFQEDLLTVIILSRLKAMLQKINFL